MQKIKIRPASEIGIARSEPGGFTKLRGEQSANSEVMSPLARFLNRVCLYILILALIGVVAGAVDLVHLDLKLYPILICVGLFVCLFAYFTRDAWQGQEL
jgi:hypothetical protein